jgi:hypothetical protein
MSITRCYRELKRLKTFEERYEYLRIGGLVGESIFSYERYLNQALYTSKRWKEVRNEVIIRDGACDLGIEGHDIYDMIVIHHMNPITAEQIEESAAEIFDPEYLICVSDRTHNAIHFGDKSLLPQLPIERQPNDMCPWR